MFYNFQTFFLLLTFLLLLNYNIFIFLFNAYIEILMFINVFMLKEDVVTFSTPRIIIKYKNKNNKYFVSSY